MSEKQVQYIFIPSLLDSLKIWQRDFGFQPSVPQLVKSLAALKKTKSVVHDDHHYLALVYGVLQASAVAKEQTLFSHAQACYQMEFGKSADAEVLCAHPVALDAGMNDISIGHVIINDLDGEQSEKLLDELNQHFSQDGWQFVLSEPGHWFLLLPKEQKPEKTLPVQQVLGQSLRSVTDDISTASDENKARWNRQLTELQMLLYNSQTNQRRESQRQPMVSSFWLWDMDEPSMDRCHKADFSPEFIVGGGYEGQVMAHYYGLDWTDFDDQPHQGSGIYLFTDLVESARLNHLDLWQEKLTLFESYLTKQLDNRLIHSIINSCAGYTWQSGPRKIWDIFARRPKKLTDFL